MDEVQMAPLQSRKQDARPAAASAGAAGLTDRRQLQREFSTAGRQPLTPAATDCPLRLTGPSELFILTSLRRFDTSLRAHKKYG